MIETLSLWQTKVLGHVFFKDPANLPAFPDQNLMDAAVHFAQSGGDVRAFEQFMRLCADAIVEISGKDPVTGLHSTHAMLEKLEREMERVARQGKPFSLLLARVDDFNVLENPQEGIRLAADVIKRTMRNYDDGYYLQNGLFLMALKDADQAGGMRAASRMRRILAEGAQEKGNLTMTCCVAEPAPGMVMRDVIQNMKDDLAALENEKDTVLEFHDVSPLEKFISEQ